MMKRLWCLFFLVVYLSCQTEKKKNTEPTGMLETGLSLEPKFQQADSVQLLYYTNPFGDSLRYTRFYTYLVSNDSSLIKTLISQLDQSFVQQSEIRPCRSNGKIFFFQQGRELKTLYFATQGKTCSYFYYIRNGLFYYFKLDKKTEQLLVDLKADTKKVEPTS